MRASNDAPGGTVGSTSFVEAQLNYAGSSGDLGAMYHAEGGSPPSADVRTVRVHDGRGAALSLDRNGALLVSDPVEIDFLDVRQVGGRYSTHMRSLVRSLTGAAKVALIDVRVRSESEADAAAGAGRPVFGVHIDLDEESIRRFMRMTHPDPESLVSGRFAMINLWRPIATVERSPLAICDASSMSAEDILPSSLGAASVDYGGLELGGYGVAYNPAHLWWYFPRMQPDEVLVFKLVDSEPSGARYTAHSAFLDPEAPAGAQPRRSVEVRTVAFFD